MRATSSGRWNQPTRPCADRRAHRAVQQHVAIVSAQRRVARVEFAGSPLAPRAPTSRAGSDALTPRTHADSGRCAARIEVHDLRERVHARVGAARADGLDALTGDLRERGFEVILHAARRRLRLPAAERAPSYSRPRAIRGNTFCRSSGVAARAALPGRNSALCGVRGRFLERKERYRGNLRCRGRGRRLASRPAVSRASREAASPACAGPGRLPSALRAGCRARRPGRPSPRTPSRDRTSVARRTSVRPWARRRPSSRQPAAARSSPSRSSLNSNSRGGGSDETRSPRVASRVGRTGGSGSRSKSMRLEAFGESALHPRCGLRGTGCEVRGLRLGNLGGGS